MSPAHLLSALGRLSVQAAVVVLVILLVQAAFRRWLTPRWRCALWLLLIARLLLPVSFESTVSIFNLVSLRGVERVVPDALLGHSMGFQSPPSRLRPGDCLGVVPRSAGRRRAWLNSHGYASASQPMSSTDTGWKPVPLQTSVLGATRSTFSADAVPAAARESALERALWLPAPASHREWPQPIFSWGLLWLAGFLFFLSRVAFRSFSWMRRFAGSPKVTDPGVLELVRECAERLGIRAQLPVYESHAVSSPVLYGVFRPRLVLPRGFVGRFTREEVGFVVLHEMVHFKRGDLILNWLITGLQAIHWFNPMVWIGFARWRADRELACDAAVLEAVGDGRNLNYGETIIQLLEGCPRQAAIPGHVGVLEAPGDLRMRMLMIMEFKPASRWSVLAFLLLAGVGVGCLTNARFPTTAALSAAVSVIKNIVPAVLPAPLRIAEPPVLLRAVPKPGSVAVAAPGPRLSPQGRSPATKLGSVTPGVRLVRADPIVVPVVVAAGHKPSVVPLSAPPVAAPVAKIRFGVAEQSGSPLIGGIRVGVVGELTSRGKKIERPSLQMPVYYIPVAIGYKAGEGTPGRPTQPPLAANVERAIMNALAGEGYLVATKASPPALILTFGWGYTSPESWQPQATSGIQAFKISGPDRFVNSTDSTRDHEILEANLHVRGYVRIYAFDYGAWRQHKVVPLWSSEVSASRSGSLDRLLPTLLAAAAPYFGRETEEEPVFVTSSP